MHDKLPVFDGTQYWFYCEVTWKYGVYSTSLHTFEVRMRGNRDFDCLISENFMLYVDFVDDSYIFCLQ